MTRWGIAAVSIAGLIGILGTLAPNDAKAQSRPQYVPVFPQQGQSSTSPQYGLRCQTSRFWCGLQQPGAVGSACVCNTPSGPVTGQVVQ
jgi:hypothetical protein